jgi:hypothetical protein
MQAKLWKMTPQAGLSPNISCWNGVPSSTQITRFGAAKYGAKISNPPTEKIKTLHDSTKSGYFGMVDESNLRKVEHNYIDGQGFEMELARERNAQNARGLEEMSIPIQPRKHIGLKNDQVRFKL